MKARAILPMFVLVAAAAATMTFAGAPGGGGPGGGMPGMGARGRGRGVAVDTGPRGPAPNQTRPATPTKAPSAEGFLQRWLVLEPIPISISSNAVLGDAYVQRTIKTEYFPNQLTVVPKDGDKVTANGTEVLWHAVDTSVYNVNLYHFAYALNKSQFNAIWWAVTVIDCPEEMKDVRLAVGSNAASIWWVNGKEVVDLYGDRHMMLDDGVSKRLTLKKGANVVRVAVVNGPGVSDFCARFLGKDDVPVTNFIVNLSAADK
jgi:hypothetical protein